MDPSTLTSPSRPPQQTVQSASPSGTTLAPENTSSSQTGEQRNAHPLPRSRNLAHLRSRSPPTARPTHDNRSLARPSTYSPSRPLSDSEEGQQLRSTRSSSSAIPRPPVSQPPRTSLQEFDSLLEAAQRIADSARARIDTDGAQWRDDDQLEPVIHLNRRTSAGDNWSGAVPRFTRQYSGRPHVPGEDSGSEAEEQESDQENEHDTRDTNWDAPPGVVNNNIRDIIGTIRAHESARRQSQMDEHMRLAEQQAEQRVAREFLGENVRRLESNRAHLHALRERTEQMQREHNIHAGRERSASPPNLLRDTEALFERERRRDSLGNLVRPDDALEVNSDEVSNVEQSLTPDQSLALLMEARRRHQTSEHAMPAPRTNLDGVMDDLLHRPEGSAESQRQRMTEALARQQQYATNGPSPTRESYYDWAPEPTNLLGMDANGATMARTRSSSVRRWRPAERLQDFASNHARRESVGVRESASINAQLDTNSSIPFGRAPESGSTPTLSGSNDVISGIERALQDYRNVRRALQSQTDEVSATNAGGPATNAQASGITDRSDRAPGRNNLSTDEAARRTNDSLNGLSDFVNDNAPNSELSRDSRELLSNMRHRRDHSSIRQRIQEQARERRRRVIGSIVDQESSFATGPLFDGGRGSVDRAYRTGEHDPDAQSTLPSNATPRQQWQAGTRRLLDAARRAAAKEDSKELKQAKAAFKYLAKLREPEMKHGKAWTTAFELGLHYREITEAKAPDLPESIDDLPVPVYTSWLEPGTTWTGTQSADHPDDASAMSRESRLQSQQETSPSSRESLDAAPEESFRARLQEGMDPLERALAAPHSTRDALSNARTSVQLLEDAERHFRVMLARSEQLLRENEREIDENRRQLERSQARLRQSNEYLATLRSVGGNTIGRGNESIVPPWNSDADRWNVKVALHSVDWESMTLTGTMTASHDPDLYLHGASNSDQPASMDSFFTGEIIDFSRYGLDTPASVERKSNRVEDSTSARDSAQQDEWKVGGPKIDLTHWASLGPFKSHIDQAIANREADLQAAAKREELQKLLLDPYPISLIGRRDGHAAAQSDSPTLGDYDADKLPCGMDSLPSSLTEEQKQALTFETMHGLLTDKDWLNTHLNSQGWILMRWKELCFVSPGTSANPDVRRPWIPSQAPQTLQGRQAHHVHRPPFLTFERAANTNMEITSTQPRGESSNTDTDRAQELAAFRRISRDLRMADLYRRRQERERERTSAGQRIWTTNAEEREERNSWNPLPATQSSAARDSSNDRAPQWGLTISGFYYVALHRVTGQIEALYYDCGSAPFQRLKMSPLGTENDVSFAQTKGDAWTEQEGDAHCDPQKALREENNSRLVGLRKTFEVVEFR